MSEYTQGVCHDGAAILKDGQPLTIEQILEAFQERDEYRDHLAVIAEMTGNKGDIGAAHEGANAVIEEREALAAHVERLHCALDNVLAEIVSEFNGSLSKITQEGLRVIDDDPTTSLARRDAQIKANELKRFIRIYLTPGLAHNRATGELQSLQKQAEGHQ
ncbi:hypothetical protein [Vreelandella venusta]|uniref:hypothetical protein n=1 Tax=Vreelandella venusta TaxID=44935 RepID=UPI003F66A061